METELININQYYQENKPVKIREDKDKIALVQWILNNHQCMDFIPKDSKKKNKVILDAFSSQFINAVYTNLSPKNQLRYISKPLIIMSKIAFKLLNKEGV